MSELVLDASALLAVLLAEEGADAVVSRLPGAYLSCVNLAEVLTRALDLGKPVHDTVRAIGRLPLRIVPFDAEQAHAAASLRPATRPLGLSLGDRACLALGLRRKAAVLTADRDWLRADVGVEVIVFR